MSRVRERERLRDSGTDSCRVSDACRQGLRSKSAGGDVDSASVPVVNSAGKSGDHDTLRCCYLEDGMEVVRHGVPDTSAVTSSSVVGVSAPCLVRRAPVAGVEDDSVFKQNAGVASSSVRRARVVGALRRSGPSAHATASESDRVIGLLEVTESEFPSLSYSVNSCLGLSTSACARVSCLAGACAGAAARVCSVSPSSAVAAVAHAHASTLHGAHNSWSDTARVQGPTGFRRVKGGVSGPAEDLLPVSEMEAGVNFRTADGVRGQVAGSRRQPGTGTRRVREGAVTPSLHPEVPGIQFVSPGRGLDIRQSMGWTKVCGTARSGIWVLKGNARTRMLPENLDHLRVRWISRGSYETAWVTPGHDCLCSYQYGHGAAIRPQTNDAIWHGVIGLWGRVAPLLSPWRARREVPTGVNLNRYSGPSSCTRWHSDNEPLFGPQNAPKLIVSMSLGNSVEFKVRRGQGKVPSLITLDHGDLLVMDGPTQSEYVHCTASGLQDPRVNLTFRWVAKHIASCPLAGAVGCVLPSCVQGLAEPGPRGEWGWGNNGPLFFGFGPSFVNLGVRSSVPAGLGDGVGHCHDVAKLPRVCLFISLVYLFLREQVLLFFQEHDLGSFYTAGHASS